MKREIEFKGKLIDGGQWVYGYLYEDETGSYIKPFGKSQRFGCGYSVIPDTVGQYTGLKDVDGNKIYVGDVCSAHSDGNGIIEWSEYDGGYDYKFSCGNIVGISEVKRNIRVISHYYDV